MSGGGKGKKATIGYRYLLGMHMGLCHGPVDKIIRVDVDGREAWAGDAAFQGDNQADSIEIDAVKLFGGDKREGGVSGTVDLLWGGPSQTANDYLVSVLGAQMPSFRGVFSVVLNKCYLGNNPYLKPWSFHTQRIHVRQDGIEQWYDEKAAIGTSLKAQSYEILKAWAAEGGPGVGDWSRAFNDPADQFQDGSLGTRWYRTTSSPPSDWIYEANFNSIAIGHWFTIYGTLDLPPLAATTYINLRFYHDDSPRGLTINGENYLGQMIQESYFYSNVVYPIAPGTTQLEIAYQVIQGVPGGSTTGFGGGVYITVLEPSEYPDEASRGDCDDMNPAHIIRECLTDPDWGMGYLDADIDDDSFIYAADTLYSETMGISILWNRQIPLEDFISEILRHIDGALYVDRVTGKFVLKLIRDDYSLTALTILDESNILEVTNSTRPTVGELTNSVSVVYWEASTGEDGSVSVQDQALIQVQGVEINTTQNYPGFTNANIASRVALRDLKALSTPLLRCEILANREADGLNIGDAFQFDWPDHNVNGAIMRVNSIEFGDTRDNAIKITAVEDVFSLASVVQFDESDDPSWQDPVTLDVQASVPRIVGEIPYYGLVKDVGELSANNILDDEPDAGFAYAVGGRQGREMLGFAYFDSGAGYGDSYYMDFCGYADVVQDVWYSDTQIYYANAVDIDRVVVGTIASIENELVRVDSFSEDSNGTYVTVGRGILDTTPSQHNPDSNGIKIIFWQDFEASDEIQYTASDEIDVKITTVNGATTLDIDDAPTDTIIMASRAVRPYPPGNIRINGLSYPAGGGLPFSFGDVISWSHRDRLQQTDDNLYDYTEGNIGPESGTTYIVRANSILAGGSESEDWMQANVGSATSYALDSNTDSDINEIPVGTEFIQFRVYSVRDGYESWQPATVLVKYEIDSNDGDDQMTLIQEITNASAGEFDFASIPQNFNRLIIKGYLRSSATGDQDTVIGFINTSTTSSAYTAQRLSAFNDAAASTTEYAEARVGLASGDSSPSGYYHSVSMEIEGYAETKQQIIKCECAGARDTGQVDVLFYSTLSPVSAAVTRLRIRTDNHPTDGLVGTLRLYGEF